MRTFCHLKLGEFIREGHGRPHSSKWLYCKGCQGANCRRSKNIRSWPAVCRETGKPGGIERKRNRESVYRTKCNISPQPGNTQIPSLPFMIAANTSQELEAASSRTHLARRQTIALVGIPVPRRAPSGLRLRDERPLPTSPQYAAGRGTPRSRRRIRVRPSSRAAARKT
jgi:hypothetical protein